MQPRLPPDNTTKVGGLILAESNTEHATVKIRLFAGDGAVPPRG